MNAKREKKIEVSIKEGLIVQYKFTTLIMIRIIVNGARSLRRCKERKVNE